MRSSSVKQQIESALTDRFGAAIKLRKKPPLELAPTDIPEVDLISGGLPRGAITEIIGPASSGRTSLLLTALARASKRQEAAALIDMSDVLDPVSAANAGVDLDHLLWVRCGGSIENVLKATDLLLQGGGFAIVAIDLADLSTRMARRIPSSYWFRFRRAIENTPTIVLVIASEPVVRSCAALSLEVNRERAMLSGPSGNGGEEAPIHSKLLQGFKLRVERRRPVHSGRRQASFETIAVHKRPEIKPATSSRKTKNKT